MRRIREGGFAQVLEVGRGDDYFKYPQIVGAKVWIAKIHERAGPWISLSGMLLSLESISLNGSQFKKGGHLWFRRAKFKPISFH